MWWLRPPRPRPRPALVWFGWVEFNAPPDTIEVISEAVFTANHLTDTDKQNSTGTCKQTQYKSEKVDNLKYSKTKLPWFSCLVQHSAKKRGGLILQRPRAHMGHQDQRSQDKGQTTTAQKWSCGALRPRPRHGDSNTDQCSENVKIPVYSLRILQGQLKRKYISSFMHFSFIQNCFENY